jgi:hypothetical protein
MVEKVVIGERAEVADRGGWISTFAGVKFYPLAPRHADVELQDIAHALSNLCRYTGHVSRFYSVAEHSVLVSQGVEGRAQAAGLPWREVRDLARWGLLHDATEAYIADVSRPLKQLAAFSVYRQSEARLQKVIAERFGLTESEPDLVRQVDSEILSNEVSTLLPSANLDEWGACWPGGKLPGPVTGLTVQGLTPESAREHFLWRFQALWGYR